MQVDVMDVEGGGKGRREGGGVGVGEKGEGGGERVGKRSEGEGKREGEEEMEKGGEGEYIKPSVTTHSANFS